MATDREGLSDRVAYGLNLSWSLFLTLAVVGAVSSPLVTAFLRLRPAEASLFSLLLLGVCVNAHANTGYEYLQAAGRYSTAALLSAMGVSSVLVLFLLLVPFGLIAIGVAWAIAETAYAIATDAVVFSHLQRSARPFVILIRGLALLAAVAVAIAKIDALPSLLAFGLFVSLLHGVAVKKYLAMAPVRNSEPI
jgi:O-antigen/teichoic acid export membrane protein